MNRLSAVALALILSVSQPLQAQDRQTTSIGDVSVDRMISDLDEPWAVAFLPSDQAVLITERDGRLLYIGPQGRTVVRGVPDVFAEGQGGLLDVVAARDFATTRTVFLSYAQPARRSARTALASATLSADGRRLSGLRVLFEMAEPSGGGRHFGSRIVEARDGTLFLTIGDRGAREQAQNLNRHNGKVIRINRDGSIPADNPFANGGGLPEIWSYGHRNPQGAALDETGTFWTVAHGARGGDEINIPQKGRNYGWPIISYGRHYTGLRIGEGQQKAGMEQPRYYWDPSIAPSGMMIYSGDMFSEWRGDIFVGSLKFNMISRLDRDGANVAEAERLFQEQYYRIRDIRQAPDGSIWFLSVGDGAAYRVSR